MKAIDLLRMSLIAGGLLLAISCSNGTGPVAGGSTDSDNARIAGRVVTADRLPVAGAGVLLYPVSTSPDTLSHVDSTSTDHDGRYVFEDVVAGAYQILSRSSDSGLISLEREVAVDSGDDLSLAASVASPAASVSGTTDITLTDSLRAFARIVGTPFVMPLSGSPAAFEFPSVAAASCTLAVIVRDVTGKAIWAASHALELSEGASLKAITIPRFVPLPAGADSLLLDDFSDGDELNYLGGYWWAFNDSGRDPAMTTPSIATARFDASPGFDSSGMAAHLSIMFDGWEYSMAGMGTDIGRFAWGYPSGYDFTGVSRIGFWARGSGNNVDIELHSPFGGYVKLSAFTPSSQWTRYEIDIPALMTGWPADNLSRWEAGKRFVMRLQFTVWHGATMPDAGDLWVDDVTLYR